MSGGEGGGGRGVGGAKERVSERRGGSARERGVGRVCVREWGGRGGGGLEARGEIKMFFALFPSPPFSFQFPLLKFLIEEKNFLS